MKEVSSFTLNQVRTALNLAADAAECMVLNQTRHGSMEAAVRPAAELFRARMVFSSQEEIRDSDVAGLRGILETCVRLSDAVDVPVSVTGALRWAVDLLEGTDRDAAHASAMISTVCRLAPRFSCA